MEKLLVNISGKVRYDQIGGRAYLVAPMTMIDPGVVLNGSRGRLIYPLDELTQSADRWNGMPIVLEHPANNESARQPKILDAKGMGFVFNTEVNGKLTAEGWFDVEKTAMLDERILPAIKNGSKIELSTGLRVAEIEETAGVLNGENYDGIARDYQPDHLAILPDSKGACSVKAGCGVNNEENEDDEECANCGEKMKGQGKKKGKRMDNQHCERRNLWNKLGELLGLNKKEEPAEISDEQVSQATTKAHNLSLALGGDTTSSIRAEQASGYGDHPTAAYYHENCADRHRSEAYNKRRSPAEPRHIEAAVAHEFAAAMHRSMINNDGEDVMSKLPELMFNAAKQGGIRVADQVCVLNEDGTWTCQPQEKTGEGIVNGQTDNSQAKKEPNAQQVSAQSGQAGDTAQNATASTQNAAASQKTLTDEEYIAALPPGIQEDILLARNVKQEKKDRLIDRLVQHHQGDAKEERRKVLNQLSLKELEDRVADLPAQPANLGVPLANFLGTAAGNTPVNNNKPQPLGLPEYEYKPLQKVRGNMP